jgi:KUP system potassium uptake protein
MASIALVLGFQASSALSAAYGIAVTGSMTITSVIYFVVVRRTWKWPLGRAALVVGTFLAFDLPFLAANALKFFHGGWLPIVAALGLFVVMTTWKTGRALLARNIAERMLPLDAFLASVETEQPHRVPGTAVFMTSNPNGTPIVLLHHWKHNQVLHRTVLLCSITSEKVPEVPESERVTLRPLGHGFHQIVARYGFMQTPNVPRALEMALTGAGMPWQPGSTSYYLGRETLLPTGHSRIRKWRKSLFAFISRNARSATDYFCIPPDRVVELGMQIDL